MGGYMAKGFAEKYLEGYRSTKAIYGIILITATLIGLQFLESKPLTIAVKLFFAALVIVLAEAYSEILGEKIRRRKELTGSERREIVDDVLVIASVSIYPVSIFLLSAAGLFSVDSAFKISYGLSIACLGLFGYLASQAAGDTKNSSLRKAVITSLVGVLVVIIKYRFSH
jgi:uncharacterized membrane protein